LVRVGAVTCHGCSSFQTCPAALPHPLYPQGFKALSKSQGLSARRLHAVGFTEPCRAPISAALHQLHAKHALKRHKQRERILAHERAAGLHDVPRRSSRVRARLLRGRCRPPAARGRADVWLQLDARLKAQLRQVDRRRILRRIRVAPRLPRLCRAPAALSTATGQHAGGGRHARCRSRLPRCVQRAGAAAGLCSRAALAGSAACAAPAGRGAGPGCRASATLVTFAPAMPHGTMAAKGARSGATLSARPWYATQRRARTPIAATWQSASACAQDHPAPGAQRL